MRPINHFLLTLALMALVAACFALTSCGVPFSFQSPYGEINSDKAGNVTVVTRPIVIPAK